MDSAAIDADPIRRAITRSVLLLCKELHITVIAEGIETVQEAAMLRGLGVRLFQGYLFASPALENLSPIAPGIIDAVRAAHELALLEAPAAALAAAM